MKKLLILLLSVMMLSIPVMASNVDLDGLDSDDLLALRDRIDSVLVEQGIGETIPGGVYEVGVDLKAGSYTFVVYKAFSSTTVYNSRDDYDNEHGDYDLYVIGDSVHFTLTDGMVIDLSQSMGISSEEAEKPSWAP